MVGPFILAPFPSSWPKRWGFSPCTCLLKNIASNSVPRHSLKSPVLASAASQPTVTVSGDALAKHLHAMSQCSRCHATQTKLLRESCLTLTETSCTTLMLRMQPIGEQHQCDKETTQEVVTRHTQGQTTRVSKKKHTGRDIKITSQAFSPNINLLPIKL